MTSEGSVTCWIDQLKEGDAEAARQLWERYFHKLVELARHKLTTLPRRAEDEEDVALSAFDSFCRDAQRGRFPDLLDRSNLWRLLLTITIQKAIDLLRRERAQKRHDPRDQLSPEPDIDQIVSREPTPELAAQVAEECQRLLSTLQRADLQAVALWKMEGYTTEEIAGKLGCVPRSVERKLQAIRGLWSQEGAT